MTRHSTKAEQGPAHLRLQLVPWKSTIQQAIETADYNRDTKLKEKLMQFLKDHQMHVNKALELSAKADKKKREHREKRADILEASIYSNMRRDVK